MIKVIKKMMGWVALKTQPASLKERSVKEESPWEGCRLQIQAPPCPRMPGQGVETPSWEDFSGMAPSQRAIGPPPFKPVGHPSILVAHSPSLTTLD